MRIIHSNSIYTSFALNAMQPYRHTHVLITTFWFQLFTMAAFPPDWQIYDNNQFATFAIPAAADAGLGAVLCVQIRPDGRATEHFKIVLFGGELI